MSVGLEYLAGFFDGEGCVYLWCNRYGSWALQVNVAQKSKVPLEAFCEVFPRGRIYERTGGMHNYIINGQAAGEMLRAIRPFLLLKGPQVDLALEALTMCRGSGSYRTTEENERMQVLSDEMRHLKRVV
jgi:hypothetical protein